MVRVEVPLPEVAPLDWLRAHPAHTQYYWADRAGEFAMAGVGEADVLAPREDEQGGLAVPLSHIRARLNPAHPSLRYYGGLRFHPGTPRTAWWQAFRDYRFVVPRFEVLRRHGRCFFACNLRPARYTTVEAALAETAEYLETLTFAPAAAPPLLPRIQSRRDCPDERQWRELVIETLGAFEETPLEKVVLARETHFAMDGPLDPAALLARLSASSVASFEFCFHPAPDRAFIGASPERLYKRTGTHIQSEAVAGTRPRGKSDAEDRVLAGMLLRSEKDQREHRFVLDMLRENLQRMCHCVNVEERASLLPLRHCQHLRTRVEGLLETADCDARILAVLHPTPAVGGTPRDLALRWIEEHEPFDRGIYASPVGWVGPDAAEFCVAIRSGLVLRNHLVVYNGAGILPGSDPGEEWDEIENKMANFLHVLGNTD